jgi:hypothetical protein
MTMTTNTEAFYGSMEAVFSSEEILSESTAPREPERGVFGRHRRGKATMGRKLVSAAAAMVVSSILVLPGQASATSLRISVTDADAAVEVPQLSEVQARRARVARAFFVRVAPDEDPGEDPDYGF